MKDFQTRLKFTEWWVIIWVVVIHINLKNIAKDNFGFLVMPTGLTTAAKAMKFSPDTTLLLKFYNFEGYLSQYKIEGMANNHLKSCN